MNKFLFIINPKAGKGRGLKILPAIKSHIKKSGCECKIEITKHNKHATEIASAGARSYNHIISVGGDGTINEIINGLDLSQETRLGFLPIGSGNDFASYFKLSKSIDDNLSLILNLHYKLRSVDLGLVKFYEESPELEKNHLFANVLGVGFDAYVSFIHQNTKIFRGLFSYIIAVFRALRKLETLDITAKLDDTEIKGKKLLITVGNGKRSGGGFYLTPNAEIDDNLLDVSLIEEIKRFKLIRSLPLALINKIEKLKEIEMYQVKTAQFELKNPYYLHADGEIISHKVRKLNVSLISNSTKIISN